MGKLIAVVVMGVSGSGKSTIGAALAQRLGWDFVEGDDLHPAANVAKMRAGHPLDDADRAPWLDRLHGVLAARVASREPVVLACSALKRRYRDRMREGLPAGAVRFAFLDVDPATLRRRLRSRRGHYMPGSLLDSQLADLEPPAPDEAPFAVDPAAPVDATVSTLAACAIVA